MADHAIVLGSSASPTRMTVLAVDDTPANLVALRAIVRGIRDYDVELVTAESGYAALSLCTNHDFALILLDVMMPGLDGFETLERIRAIPETASTPVIFLTAVEPTREWLHRAYGWGAADYVAKPVDSEILAAKIGVFLALHSQADDLRKKQEALVAKDRFIRILAHALRTPLSVIRTATEVLRSKPDERALLSIVRACRRVEILTRDVREFAGADAGQVELEPTRLNLTALCTELLDDLAAAHPQVTFTRDLPPLLIGVWDSARLQQAVANLLDNAVKYGEGQVSLRVEQPADATLITVENTGKPIPEERIRKLFVPFERGTHANSGAGLGLYIVHEIAKAHGGEVTVSSSEDKTVFQLRVPIGSLGDPSSATHLPG